MFEQYGYEELRHLALSTDNEDMYAEYRCRQAAKKFKDLSDEEMKDSNRRFYAHFGPPSRYHELMSIELLRRDAKAEGVTELPVRIEVEELSPNENAFMKKAQECSLIEIELEDENKLPNPDSEKVNRLEQKLKICDDELDRISDIIKEERKKL